MSHYRLRLAIASSLLLAAGCTTGQDDTRIKSDAAAKGAPAVAAAASSYDRPGYITEVHDGRLWVFHKDSKAYNDFKTQGEPAKVVTRIAAGPNRMTVRSTDAEIIDGYLLTKPSYVAEVHDGRLWVFEAGSKVYTDFKTQGEPAKVVTRIGAGPNGMTIRSTDAKVIDGYLAANPY